MRSDSLQIPISALQQWMYCPRRCGLIHVERVWSENRFTAEGRVGHQTVHREHGETRRGLRREFGVWIRSDRLGLTGQADVVEFTKNEAGQRVALPIEHKRFALPLRISDRVQLAAQAMCLEEMLGTPVPVGALFCGKTRRRLEVAIDAELRAVVENAAREVREALSSGVTPRVTYASRKCDSCSMWTQCAPKACSLPHSGRQFRMDASEYLRLMLGDPDAPPTPTPPTQEDSP